MMYLAMKFFHAPLMMPLLALGLAMTSSLATAQNTNNPIDAIPPVAPWSITLEDVVTIPNNGSNVPRLEDIASGGAPGELYAIEQRGQIYRFDPHAASPTPSLWLDVGAFFGGDFKFNNEAGLHGLTFHPDFNNPETPGFHKFYTVFAVNNGTPTAGSPSPALFTAPGNDDHESVVAEWTAQSDGSVDIDSYREIMRIEQPFSNHDIGRAAFNPTAASGSADYGKLYIGLGDGGSGGDPNDLAQDVDLSPAPYLNGKILRIDPIATSDAPYTVPSDNPFAGQADRVQEAWAYGFRNPQKFSWDAKTGEMLISDIGQGNVEEIDRGVAGGNYGWHDREGTFVYNGGTVGPLPADHATDNYIYPVAQYDHDFNNDGSHSSSAVTGGFVYRGTEIPELTGVYLFAEFATNNNPIYAVDVDDLVDRDDFTDVANRNNGFLAPFEELKINDHGEEKTILEFLNDENGANYSRSDTRFGEGPDGAIYVTNKRDGTIRRISGVVGLSLGDANRDGSVDADDLARWQAGYGADGDWSNGNFDASAAVDGSDFLAWQRNVSSGNANAVPEPGALALLTAVSALSLLRRQRRNE